MLIHTVTGLQFTLFLFQTKRMLLAHTLNSMVTHAFQQRLLLIGICCFQFLLDFIKFCIDLVNRTAILQVFPYGLLFVRKNDLLRQVAYSGIADREAASVHFQLPQQKTE